MSLNLVRQENHFYTGWDFDLVQREKCVQNACFNVQDTSSTFYFFSWGNPVFPKCEGVSAVRMDAHAIFKDEKSCKLHSMCLLHIKQGLVLPVNAVAVHLSFIHVCFRQLFFKYFTSCKALDTDVVFACYSIAPCFPSLLIVYQHMWLVHTTDLLCGVVGARRCFWVHVHISVVKFKGSFLLGELKFCVLIW